MATQEALFSRDNLPMAELFAPVMIDTAPADHGNNGRPPAPVFVQDAGVNLAKKTVCIKMRLSTMGNTRKVSTS